MNETLDEQSRIGLMRYRMERAKAFIDRIKELLKENI